MPFNPHEFTAPNFYDEVGKMSPSELLDQRRAMRARLQDQKDRVFSSEAPYFITSFDRLKDMLYWGDLNDRIDNIKLPERAYMPVNAFSPEELRQQLERLNRRTKQKIPTRSGRR